MKLVRVIYKPDKTISIIHYAPMSSLSYEESMAKTTKECKFENLPFDDIDKSLLPQTRKYRNAWESEKGKPITLNQAKKDAIDAMIL